MRCMGQRNVYGVWIRKAEVKRPLVRPRCRSEDNIKMGLKEVGWEGMDGINLAQDMG
jgi:hypothetical protein